MTSLSQAACLFLTAALILIFRRAKQHSLESEEAIRLPPGPKPIPILGNVHQLPQEYQQRTFGEWGRTYGDVVYAHLFRTPAIVLNSLRAARDLMDKRSCNYSGRPRLTLLVELMGWDSVITHMPYDSRWRKHRKWIQEALQCKDALLSYRPLHRRETYIFLSSILDKPDMLLSHIRRYAAAQVLDFAYNHKVTSLDDKLVQLAERATTETVLAGSPGSMLVDFFPILRHLPDWLPGAGFKKRAMGVREHVRRMLDTPYEMVKSSIVAGTAATSFTASRIEEASRAGLLTEEEEVDIKGAAGVLYAAGTDTTTAVLSTFFLAMVLHQDAYKKAQQEIDSVIGQDRLPDFNDRASLPYLDSLVKEVLRWNCPVPLSIPHTAAVDDEYRDYHIPAGVMVIPNLWAMTQDTTLYCDPEHFRPERFLQDIPGREVPIDPKEICFGFGRRKCPGLQFADASIWFLVANAVATLDIVKAHDASGREITPAASFISGFVSHPKPYECHIRARSEKTAALISEMLMVYTT
ncbi:cytochrome P450 monooxygenase [Obba rivulosa]|uniref:Cytochrome P450 monooxygenase n=1 Tax=Obba rivulosa TaxID=1052685 RepID=A0A8E2ASM1_9APHY|nr:cytochrome P450 monooxygenase [Obba rivulosa]